MFLDKLEIYKPKHRILFFTSIIIAALLSVSFIFINPIIAILIPIVSIMSYIVYKNPINGLYGMIFLIPWFGLSVSVFNYNLLIIDLYSLFFLIVVSFKFLFTFLFDRKEFEKIKFPLIKSFGLFVIASLLSIINSRNVFFSVEYLIRFVTFCYLAFIVLPVNVLKDKKQLKNVMFTLLLTSLIAFAIQFIYVFKEGFSVNFRGFISSVKIGDFYPFAFNHNVLAEVYTLGFFAAIYMSYVEENKYWKFLYFVSVTALFLANIFILSRASFLAVLVGASCIFIIAPFVKNNKSFKKCLFEISFRAVILIILAVVGLGFFTNLISGENEEEVDSSNGARYEMSVSATNMFKMHPLFGNGLANYKMLLGEDENYMEQYYVALDSHGVIQKIMAEQGLFGIITFMSFIISLFVMYFKSIKEIKVYEDRVKVTIAFSLFVAALFMELFNTTYYTHRFWLPMGIYISSVMIFKENKKEIKRIK